jgi:glycosyltransferase involved in cell wall biosynthesis
MRGIVMGPTISIVVPTRNRPDHAAECAASILRCDGFLELVVVDQSDNHDTEAALAAITDPRLRCLRSNLRGATNGRNVGIAATRGDIIAFTDDDCRVALDWVSTIAKIFAEDPAAAVVCGRVRVPEEYQRRGFAVSFEPDVREWPGRFPPHGRDWGITANFSIRRSVVDQVGAFDPLLGPGAPLLCGEEPDILFRVLRAGLKVVNATEVLVDHLGIRAFGDESRALFRTYAVGTAAALVKHIRLGDPAALWLYMRFLGTSVLMVPLNLARGTRPTGLGFTLHFLSGSLNSFKFPIDRTSRSYFVPTR